jgi:hypothetical protein
MSKREKQSLCLISMRREQSKAMAQSIAYTKARTCSNQAASISALFGCVSTYLLNQDYSSEGQERRYVKCQGKETICGKDRGTCLWVPLKSFLAKGNRDERGGHHATIWTDLSVKHTEEIKVTQPPFKCMYYVRPRTMGVDSRIWAEPASLMLCRILFRSLTMLGFSQHRQILAFEKRFLAKSKNVSAIVSDRNKVRQSIKLAVSVQTLFLCGDSFWVTLIICT